MKKNDLLLKIAFKIKELRKDKSLTLRELEALTNIENSNLSRLESGTVNPTLTTLYKISQAFGIKLSELVDFE